jgi:hypothetical protein
MKDLYSLQAALPARFQRGSTFQMSLASANSIYQLVGGGSTEPKPFNDARDQLLMRPWHENSVLLSFRTYFGGIRAVAQGFDYPTWSATNGRLEKQEHGRGVHQSASGPP